MFTLLTGPGYDADGDLSWGTHWDPHAEHDWTADGCPEEDDNTHRYRVTVWYLSSSTHEQRSCPPQTGRLHNTYRPW